MKFSITGIYICAMLPIALGFIHKRREEGNSGGFYPLIFLFALMVVNMVKSDNIWKVMYFSVRRLFF
jgi:hypothetical protein